MKRDVLALPRSSSPAPSLCKAAPGTIHTSIKTLLAWCFFGASICWFAPELYGQEFTYTSSGNAIVITGYIGSGGNVGIPNTIDGLPVVALSDGAFGFRTNVTAVTIPDSVTEIGKRAFQSCEVLTNAVLGEGVANLGDLAFSGCTKLPFVLLPGSLTNFGTGVFLGCSSLTSIEVAPANPAYATVDGVLFDKGQKLLVAYPSAKGPNYAIPDGVTHIGDLAFSQSGLTNVSMPDSLTDIGVNAFAYSPGLSNIRFGQGLISIGDSAFNLCSLTSLVLPDSVKFIGDYAFEEYFSLSNLVLGSQVLTIGVSAFESGQMTNVLIPESVTYIGPAAFDFCQKLMDINVAPLNRSYSSQDGVLFNKAKNTLLRFPGGKAGAYTIPEGVTTIAGGAFLSCLNLTNVIIPRTLTYVGNVAFYESYNLQGLFFEGYPPKLGQTALGESGTVYYLPGTPGWGTTFGGLVTKPWALPYPVIVSPAVRSKTFGFIISWATNIPVVVEASTNLSKLEWRPVQTNGLVSGASYFLEPQWLTYRARFYRLRSQ